MAFLLGFCSTIISLFNRLCHLRDYYIIGTEKKDGFSYALYLNEGARPKTSRQVVVQGISLISRYVACKVVMLVVGAYTRVKKFVSTVA